MNAEPPPVGSLMEEASALIAALSGLARQQGSQYAGAASSAAGAAASAAHGINEHLATGSPECTVCPVCQMIHVVRSTSPEVKAHLMVAANALIQAASSALATQSPQGETSPVEKIDLDDDTGWEES